eukprot:g1967.t1
MPERAYSGGSTGLSDFKQVALLGEGAYSAVYKVLRDCTGEIIDAANQMMNAGQKLTVDDMLEEIEAEAAPRIPEHHPEREWQKQGLMINALAHAARWAASDAMDGSTPSADNAEASERGEEPEAPAQGEEVIIQALIDSLRPMLRTFLAQTRRKPRHSDEELKKWQTKEAAQKAETATRALEHAIWNHHKTIALNQDYDVISERCCESSLRVFCQTLFTNKILPEGLLREFQKDFEDNDLKPTVTIYFKIPVEEAKRRIKERARFFEQDIVAEESEYLRNLEKEYDLIYGADRPDVVPIEAAVPEGPDSCQLPCRKRPAVLGKGVPVALQPALRSEPQALRD